MNGTREKLSITREIPSRGNYDVVVAGGGIAGSCAAIAAARQGARVMLVERLGILGGNGTSGGVGGFCGRTSGQGEVFDDILNALKRFNALGPPPPPASFFGVRRYDPAILAFVLQELVLRENIDVLFHARAIDVVLNDDEKSLDHLIIAGKSGLEAVAARQFIDCTGEADVAFLAGCETMKGRPADGAQLPMSIMFFLWRHGSGKERRPVPPDFFPWESYTTREQLPMTSISRLGGGRRSVKVKVPKHDATSTDDLSRAEIEGRRAAMRVLHYFQEKRRKRWNLDHCASIIGIREGRRVVGLHILGIDEVRAEMEFDDAVAVGTFPLDAHDPGDDKRTYILTRDEMRVPPYHVPLRCLIARDVDNLLVAGRNISVDQLVLSSARVMTTCAMTGQAAGMTAATCAREDLSPADLVKRQPSRIGRMMVERNARLDRSYYKKPAWARNS